MILSCQVLTEKLLQSKYLLVESEINQLKKLSLDYFLGKALFDREDDSQNYVVFQPMYK